MPDTYTHIHDNNVTGPSTMQNETISVLPLGAHEQHNKLVDARQLLHEAPRILASACPAVDHGLALVLRFGAQDLEAGSPGQFVALGFHSTSLRATSPSRLVLWNPTALPSREDNASA